LKYWYIPSDYYYARSLPAKKEGIVGSVVAANNIGISRYLDEDKIKASIEILKFISSKSAQKNVIIKNGLFSAINELYDDPEVCEMTDCEFAKDIQPFVPVNYDRDELSTNYYREKYQEYIFEFLYGNKTIPEVLKKIEDMTRNYYFSFNLNDSFLGLITFIIFILVIVNMLLSISLLYIKKTKVKLNYLSNYEWMIHISGNIIMMCSILTLYVNSTSLSCHIRTILISVGFIVSLTPILSKMIINIPVHNKLSEWTKIHNIVFKLSVISIGIILNGMSILSTYDVKKVVNIGGKNFLECSMNNISGKFLLYIAILYDILIIIFMFILLFMEWNLKESHSIIRFILSALCMDIIFLCFLSILMKISFKNYITYNLLFSLNIVGFSLTNYIFIYISNAILAFIKQEEEDVLNTEYNKRVHQNTNYSINNSNVFSNDVSNNSMDSENTNKKSKTSTISNAISNRILLCHYMESSNSLKL